jgi:glycosyltransferase involved in cell wall biosynthesis
MQKHVYMIGRDRTALQPGSPLSGRLERYGALLPITLVIMGTGNRVETTIGTGVTVIAPGGSSIIGAFIKATVTAVHLGIKQRRTFTVVTTQDVLYAGILGYIVAKILRLPFYVQLHGDYLDNPAWFASKVGVGNKVMNNVGKWLLRRADGVRAVSLRLKEQLVRDFHIEAERIISLPIGTDLGIFAKTDEGVRTKELLFVGRLIPEKEPFLFCDVAIAVARERHDVTIGIAGDGFLKDEIEKKFADAGLRDRVHFYGSLDQPTLAKKYASVYCYIHTAGWEGWGMPMIESMAAGCPVVTTDSGCAGEAIRHDETGLVVPVGDVPGLIRETKRLLGDEVLWRKLVEAGRREATVWSIDELSKKNMNWYEQAHKR